MFLKSLLFKKRNRYNFKFRKLKPVVLLYLSVLPIFNAFTESDFEFGDNDIIFLSPLKNTLTEKGKKKAEALTNYALGWIEFKKSYTLSDKALEKFYNAVKNDPEGNTPLTILRRYWVGTDRNDELIKKLLPVAKENPKAVNLSITLANSLKAANRSDEAVELLKKSLEALGFDTKHNKNSIYDISEIIYSLVLTYGETKEWSKGENLLDTAFEYEEFRNSLTVRTAAAKFYSLCADQGPDGFFAGWNKRRYREKLEHNLDIVEKKCETFKLRSISLFPILEIHKRYSMNKRAENLVLSQILLQPNDPKMFIIYAKVLEDNKNFADAFRAWNIIINTERFPNIKDIWQKAALVFDLKMNLDYQLGYSALMSERWDDALKAFDLILMKNPNDSSAIFQLGFTFLQMGKYRKAIYKFEKVSGIADSNYFMAHCYRMLGKYEKAMELMQIAENLGEQSKENKLLNRDFYLEYAFISDKAKKHNKTESILKNLLEETPDDPLLNNFLGYLWADINKNLDEAQKLIEKALDTEPDNSAYLDSMAWVLYRKKDYENALDYIEESLDNSETPLPDAVIVDHAGDIHAALGNKKEALKYWQQALETYSTDTDPEKIKEKIDSIK